MDALILIGILLFTIVAFARNWLPIDVTAMASLGLLLVFDLVTPAEAVAGFSNPAVITVLMMFILAEALVQSGVVMRITSAITLLARGSKLRAASTILGLTAFLSAFVNNTATVSIFMPVAIDLAKRFRFSPSKILMPLSFAAILGGTTTLIGTSTNLLVSSLAEENGLGAFGVFEFLSIGIVFVVLGMIYNFAAMRFLPDRTLLSSLTSKYRMDSYLTEVKLTANSKLTGTTVLAEQISDRFSLNVLEILRGRNHIATDIRYTPLLPDDVLIVRGAMDDIMAFKEHYRLLLLSDIKLEDSDLSDENNVLAEIQLSPNTSLAGATLKEVDFRKTYGSFVLALSRAGSVIRDKLAFAHLRAGDTLLVFGPRQRIEGLTENKDFVPLQQLNVRLRLSKRWWVGALTIPLVVTFAALGIMPILKSAILGTVLVLVTRAVRIQQAYKAVDWTVIFLLATILPLGTAMKNTGLADMIGSGLNGLAGPLGAIGVLSLIIFVTSAVTGFISNNTAAVLMVPICFSIANHLQVDPKPFLMGVAYAASMCFFTPMGYQTNIMVFGPGGYRFGDFVRTGGPLNILFWLVGSLLIPLVWPF